MLYNNGNAQFCIGYPLHLFLIAVRVDDEDTAEAFFRSAHEAAVQLRLSKEPPASVAAAPKENTAPAPNAR